MDDDSASCFNPKELNDLKGQSHLFGLNKPLYSFYYSDSLSASLVLYGPPGVGKTSYALLLAEKHNLNFIYINATSSSSKDIRQAVSNGNVLLLIDELHRFDKRQQDILLPYLENGNVVMLGTSTYNPYFRLTKALRSRCFVYEFKPLSNDDLNQIANRAIDCLSIDIEDNALNSVIMYANHDARRLINMLKLFKEKSINKNNVKDFFSVDTGYINESERYDLISAFIKSIRGSDVDASLYYLARLIKANEDPEFIARRLCILASEDVGLADNNAINIASSALNIVKEIGLPECAITLAHCCIYLAKSKKSNSSYLAVKKALKDIEDGLILDIPEHLKVRSKKAYLYPHNYKNSFVKQIYITKKVKYFEKRENDLI